MAPANGVRHFYESGPFRLDPNRHRLLRDGELVPLSPNAIEILTLLVQNPGKLLEREALMQAVWSDTIVEDANLTVAISQLRKALNQNGDAAEFIQTISRIGYRFVGEVRNVEERPSSLNVDKQMLSPISIGDERGGFHWWKLLLVSDSAAALEGETISRRNQSAVNHAMEGSAATLRRRARARRL